MKRYDIVIIGSGPGGYVAAARAGKLGAKVAVVEKGPLGGTCLNSGCIPTKTLIHSSRLAAAARSMADFGVSVGEVKIDYARMAARKDKVVGILGKGVKALLSARNVDVIGGTARLTGATSLEVSGPDGDTRTLAAKTIIVATGSEPARPGIFSFDGERVLTSKEALALEAMGDSVIIVGGGYIGTEFASLYANLGLKVTVLELLDSILVTQDDDVIKLVARGLKRRKVKVRTGVRVESLAAGGQGAVAVLEGGEEVTADFALVAVGRVPISGGIGLEEAGVETERGFVVIDEHCRTNIESVYAIGDVTGKLQLAHVASAQAVVAVEHALGRDVAMDYRVVPACVFADPEVASVGITEREAVEEGLDYKVGVFQFRALGKAQAEGHLEGIVKIIGEAATGKVLGAHIVGHGASDMIGELALAMKTGATIKDIYETIHAHPTMLEAVKEASEDFADRAIHVI